MSIKQVPDNLLICIMRQSQDGKVQFRSVQIQMCIVNSGGAWRSSRFIQQLDAFLTTLSSISHPQRLFRYCSLNFSFIFTKTKTSL